MKRRINEIFYSLQGEGHFTGTPAVFIRFSGCNLKCDFCDTAHEEGVLMTEEEIVAEANKYPPAHVVLTGGEPSMHVTPTLVALLKNNGKFVQIETNGTNNLPDNIDWITCSPKPDSTPVLMNVNELKVVYTGQDMNQYKQFKASVYYLQPCSGKNTQEVIEYILAHPTWRLSLQTHKLLDIR